ncbi:S41 family peptidase [Acidobacteriota bacterium]
MKIRLIVISIVVFGLSSLLGGVLGDRVQRMEEQERAALKQFTEILSVLEKNFPEDTDSKELIEGAIRGALRRLDPHSSYLDSKSYKAMREEQKGSFSGLGIVVTKKGDHLTVISPIEGTPAYRMGIRAGDIISHIEGEQTESLSLDEAVNRLKGKKGTKVNIHIKRFNVQKPIPMSIVRDDIPTKSITKSFMMTKDIGYIRIKNFTRTTSDELEETVEDLIRQGMKKLVLDLRLNPGGLLEQAVKVTSQFLDRGQVVVGTRGRTRESNNIYRGENGAKMRSKPLIVLVNRASASASEILAGAVQDHDRGLVIGEITWGKGLVQSVFPLRYDSGLALTTARYYTPSGRSIQRDYTSWEDYYDPEHLEMEESLDIEEEDAVRTDTGRPVYGGGGIRPDIILKQEPLSPVLERLFEKDLFFKYSVQYTAKHPELKRHFNIADEYLDEFRNLALEQGVEFKDEDWKENLSEIALRVKWQVSAAKLWQEDTYQIEAEMDTVLKEAIKYFPQAEELMNQAASLVAEGKGKPDEPIPDAEAKKDFIKIP